MTQKPASYILYISRQVNNVHQLAPNDQYTATEFSTADEVRAYLENEQKERKFTIIFCVYGKDRKDVTDSEFKDSSGDMDFVEQFEFRSKIKRYWKTGTVLKSKPLVDGQTVPAFVAADETQPAFKAIDPSQAMSYIINKK